MSFLSAQTRSVRICGQNVSVSVSRDGFVQSRPGSIFRHYKLEKSYARGETFSKLHSEGGGITHSCVIM